MSTTDPALTRTITGHHDGHDLAASIQIDDGPGPGGASHVYVVHAGDESEVARIQYQCGPRNVGGSTPGVLDSSGCPGLRVVSGGGVNKSAREALALATRLGGEPFVEFVSSSESSGPGDGTGAAWTSP